MKKAHLLCAAALMWAACTFAQPVGTPPTPFTTFNQARAAWYRGGNVSGLTPAGFNIFGFTAGSNNQIWHQTNGFNRMMMDNGAGGINAGRIAFGNNLPSGFVPQDRLHSHVSAIGINFFRFSTPGTGSAGTDGYRIGILNNGEVRYVQNETQAQLWFLPNARTGGTITEFMRLQNAGAGPCVGNSTDGYVGLNQPNPVWHIDGITPAHSLGEMFIGFNPSDVPNSKMGLWNGAGGDGVFLPIVFGSVDVSQLGPGLQVMGNIAPNNDAAANNTSAVTRFVSGQGLQFNCVGLQPLAQRHLFSWQNAGSVHMLMEVNGRLRVMRNLAPLTDIPNNRVEITAHTSDPYGSVIIPNGASGLRLTHLTSAKIPIPNPGPGVLSVDANGDVIYVPGGGSASLGNSCATPGSNPLTGNWEIPMGGFNFFFSQDAPLADKVNVGYACSALPAGKLNITTSVNTDPSNPQQSFGVHSVNNFNGTVALTTGVYGEATPTALFSTGRGVWGKATGGRNAMGVFGEASSSTGAAYGGYFQSIVPATNGNIAVNAFAMNGSQTIGVASNAIGAATFAMGGSFTAWNAPVNNIGISGIGYATVSPGAPTYLPGFNIGVYGQSNFNGSGSPGSDWAGWFDGDVNINGAGYITSGVWTPSDRRYKENIKPLEKVSEKIKKLTGYTYDYKVSEFGEKNFDEKTHIGLIAQELKEVFPELVKEDKNGYYTVSYEGMVPVLLEAIKDLQKQVDELKTSQQTGMINTTGTNATSQQNIDLSDKNIIVLNQNVPNPFAEHTVITYNIPENTGTAQMLFYNIEGQLIKAVDITAKGKGQLNVFANDLSSGIYTYSLVVDGQVTEAKKMIKQ